ncbi:hypothetical protein BS47DRAFT_556232 [Hydnum rufescens UP504]|uniref:Uncharacterized protein n=1 Tax=Hydnum rufescens UP504 TaxID=1448309 RepID=A0A9P6B3Z7_9AGAM|nr:hypothetical protein BS47DRAFT_556232 [Hydnum rufescens UP504]
MDQSFYRHSFLRGNTLTSRTSRALTVQVPSLLDDLDGIVEFPRSIEIGLPPRLIFTITSRHDTIDSIILQPENPTNAISFQCEQAVLCHGDVTETKPSGDSVTCEVPKRGIQCYSVNSLRRRPSGHRSTCRNASPVSNSNRTEHCPRIPQRIFDVWSTTSDRECAGFLPR